MAHLTNTYITLCSNADLSYFPKNNTSKFINKVLPSINLTPIGNFEVGVQSISCTPNINLASNTKQIIHFDSSQCELHIKKPIPQTYSLTSSSWKLLGLTANRLYAALTAAASNLLYIVFTQTYNENSDFFVTLTLSMPKDHILFMDPKLGKLLGFDQYIFSENGVYTGKIFTQQSIDLYKQDSFELSIIKLEDLNIKLQTPEDDSLDALADSVNTVFEENNVDASFTIAGDEQSAQIVVNTAFMTVKFPPFLLEGLALPDGRVFKEGTHIIDLSHLKLDNQRAHLLLCSNIIEERRYCSSLIPILRIIPFSQLSKTGYVEFHPIQYSTVNVQSVSEILIEILNDKFRSISLGSMPVTVTLHLRLKNEN